MTLVPEFDAEGRISSYEVGDSSSLLENIVALLERSHGLEDILAPFTTNPARLLRLSKKGRIQAGADADLVVVDDPFTITDVMAAGRWHVRAGKRQITGTFEK